MEDFPFTDADAGVTPLMGLVTIVATQVLHGAVGVDFNLIDGKEAEALAIKTFICLWACTSA